MHQDVTLRRYKSIWKILLILIGITVIIVAAYEISRSQNFYRTEGQDFFAIWLAPHILLEGNNPYNSSDWISAYAQNQAQWVKDPTFLYPLPLAILLLPIGLLPVEYSATLWITFGIITVLVTTYLLLRTGDFKLPGSYLVPIIFGILLFRAVAETFRLGQLDWLILLILIIALSFWGKQRWFIGGIIIGFSVLKPQIGIPLLVFISIWLAVRHIWTGLLGEIISFLGLFTVGWLFNHSWLVQWFSSGTVKIYENICCTPTLWGLASGVCNFNLSCGSKLGLVLTLLASGLAIYLVTRIPTHQVRYVFGLIIPLALLISPYLWTYSQIILVIPILMIVHFFAQNKIPYLVTATFPLWVAFYSAAIVYISMKIGVDIISATVPLVIFGITFWVYQKYVARDKSLSVVKSRQN